MMKKRKKKEQQQEKQGKRTGWHGLSWWSEETDVGRSAAAQMKTRECVLERRRSREV